MKRRWVPCTPGLGWGYPLGFACRAAAALQYQHVRQELNGTGTTASMPRLPHPTPSGLGADKSPGTL
ncbi:hypothetical protein L207DRAFT_513712 [Hyaloscypha variabilis F]|uniref:Uncharacterized protein n=1 Tax=Hyaloscypha variabilis (strain UAMH 11265 / GT02V1 / F) TaxID=1149755 RepID=A0A2J6RL58_HYAVF|nr:hypothetical protein L207DRAFT_513712 [Hyaloscypha variabilis F]